MNSLTGGLAFKKNNLYVRPENKVDAPPVEQATANLRASSSNRRVTVDAQLFRQSEPQMNRRLSASSSVDAQLFRQSEPRVVEEEEKFMSRDPLENKTIPRGQHMVNEYVRASKSDALFTRSVLDSNSRTRHVSRFSGLTMYSASSNNEILMNETKPSNPSNKLDEPARDRAIIRKKFAILSGNLRIIEKYYNDRMFKAQTGCWKRLINDSKAIQEAKDVSGRLSDIEKNAREYKTIMGVSLDAATITVDSLDELTEFLLSLSDEQFKEAMIWGKIPGEVDLLNLCEQSTNFKWEDEGVHYKSNGQTKKDFRDFSETLCRTVYAAIDEWAKYKHSWQEIINPTQLERIYEPAKLYKLKGKETDIPYKDAAKIRMDMLRVAKNILSEKTRKIPPKEKTDVAAKSIEELFQKNLNHQLASHNDCQETIKKTRIWDKTKLNPRTGSDNEAVKVELNNELIPLHTLEGGLVMDNNKQVWKKFKVSHDYVTEYPVNAWKADMILGNESVAQFYRVGTFGVNQSSLPKAEWKNAQQIANQRVKHFAGKVASDYFSALPPDELKGFQKEDSTYDFNLSNLNLMRDSLLLGLIGESKLTQSHQSALRALGGETHKVKLADGQEIQVKFNVRTWRQNPTSGRFIKPDKVTTIGNKEALKSSKSSLLKLLKNKKATSAEKSQALQLYGIINKEIDKQNCWFSSFFNKAMNGYELSAVIMNYEMILCKYEPGAVSEGCRSGKDRGSLVDATTRTLAFQLTTSQGVPDCLKHYKRGQGMLNLIREGIQPLEDVFKDVVIMNHTVQKINLGTKGYITNKGIPDSIIDDMIYYAFGAFNSKKERKEIRDFIRGANYSAIKV